MDIAHAIGKVVMLIERSGVITSLLIPIFTLMIMVRHLVMRHPKCVTAIEGYVWKRRDPMFSRALQALVTGNITIAENSQFKQAHTAVGK